MLTDTESEILRLSGVMPVGKVCARLRLSRGDYDLAARSIREKLSVAPDADLRDVQARASEDSVRAAVDAFRSRTAHERRQALLFARAALLSTAEHVGTAQNAALLLYQLAWEQE